MLSRVVATASPKESWIYIVDKVTSTPDLSVIDLMVFLDLLTPVMEKLYWDKDFLDPLFNIILTSIPSHNQLQEHNQESEKNSDIVIEDHTLSRIEVQDVTSLRNFLILLDKWVDMIKDKDILFYGFLFKVLHSVASFMVDTHLGAGYTMDTHSSDTFSVEYLQEVDSITTSIIAKCIKENSECIQFENLLRYSESLDSRSYEWDEVGVSLFLWQGAQIDLSAEIVPWIPTVYLKTHLFEMWISHVTALLRKSYIIGVNISYSILGWIPQQYQISCDSTIDQHNFTFNDPLLENIYMWIQAITDYAVRCPEKSIRQRCINIFRRIISLLNTNAKFNMIHLLLRLCPYMTLKLALIYELKEQVFKDLELIELDPSYESPFISKRVFEEILIPFALIPKDVLETSDVLNSALNMLVLILIKDKNTQKFFFWKDKQAFLKLTLEPLRNEINRAIYTEMKDSETYEQQQTLLAQIQAEALPEMTLQKMDQAQKMNILKLQVVYNVISRIEELMK